jgi:iron complex outermembrane recepter protein
LPQFDYAQYKAHEFAHQTARSNGLVHKKGSGNMKTTFKAVLLSSIAVTGLSAAPVFAQEETDSASERREVIVVTARRREESIQDVPVAVSAFSGDQLEAIGATDLTALNQSVPNVTFEVSRGTNSTLTAFIRGVGQQDPVAGFEQGVGIYLDDVYLNRPQGAVLDIYDVERIEVLRGPQGTLYGRNTIGGAVKYVTKRLNPDEPELNLRGSVGSYGQFDAVASFSAPVDEDLRFGASFARLTRDGFGDNQFTGEDNYNKDVLGARASVEWEPSDTVSLRLAADYVLDESNPRQGYRPLASTVTARQPLSSVFDTRAGITATGPISDNSVESFGLSFQAEIEVNDNVTLKSITGLRSDETETPIDFDSTEAPTFEVPAIYENEQFSQEFQALLDYGRWNGVVGVYLLEANAFNGFDASFSGGAASFTLGDVDTNTWAIFGEFTYDLTDRLHLTLGGRYTEDTRSATVTRATYLGASSPFFGGTGPSITAVVLDASGTQVVPTFRGRRTDDAFTPRVTLAYDATDDINVYVSYSEGFKGGGFDPRGNFSTQAIRDGFAPEEVTSYEAGLKGNFFDGRVSANAAIFVADYENVQIPGSVIITLPGGLTSFQGTVTNAGAAEFTGLELEGTAFLTDRLSVSGALGYIDAEYTEFVSNGVNIAANTDVQNTPDWTGNISANYTYPIAIDRIEGEMSLIASAAYRGETQQFEFPIPLLDQDAYWLYDASAVFRAQSGGWSVGLHGKNLSDEEYVISGYNFPTVDSSILQFYGNPRTVTATFSLHY